ncbi:MAG: DUF3099 domain-containing protein [Mycobacteriales bacterium]
MAERETVVVTTAGLSGSDDRRLRRRRYLVTQAIRLSCFVLAVFLPVALWAKLVLIVGAFTLPWMGVVAANGGPTVQRAKGPTAVVPHEDEPLRIALEPGRTIDAE